MKDVRSARKLLAVGTRPSRMLRLLQGPTSIEREKTVEADLPLFSSF